MAIVDADSQSSKIMNNPTCPDGFGAQILLTVLIYYALSAYFWIYASPTTELQISKAISHWAELTVLFALATGFSMSHYSDLR